MCYCLHRTAALITTLHGCTIAHMLYFWCSMHCYICCAAIIVHLLLYGLYVLIGIPCTVFMQHLLLLNNYATCVPSFGYILLPHNSPASVMPPCMPLACWLCFCHATIASCLRYTCLPQTVQGCSCRSSLVYQHQLLGCQHFVNHHVMNLSGWYESHNENIVMQMFSSTT